MHVVLSGETGEFMRDLYAVRRENLRLLAGRYATITEMGAACGHASGSYLSQLMAVVPNRDMSERVARGLEKRLKLPIGWFDSPQSG